MNRHRPSIGHAVTQTSRRLATAPHLDTGPGPDRHRGVGRLVRVDLQAQAASASSAMADRPDPVGRWPR